MYFKINLNQRIRISNLGPDIPSLWRLLIPEIPRPGRRKLPWGLLGFSGPAAPDAGAAPWPTTAVTGLRHLARALSCLPADEHIHRTSRRTAAPASIRCLSESLFHGGCVGLPVPIRDSRGCFLSGLHVGGRNTCSSASKRPPGPLASVRKSICSGEAAWEPRIHVGPSAGVSVGETWVPAVGLRLLS